MSQPCDERLWRLADGTRALECVMISCCNGAELQVRAAPVEGDRPAADVEIVLRELYPTKSDLYERARALETEYQSRGLT